MACSALCDYANGEMDDFYRSSVPKDIYEKVNIRVNPRIKAFKFCATKDVFSSFTSIHFSLLYTAKLLVD